MSILGSRYGPSHAVSDESGWFIRAIGGNGTKSSVAVSEYTALQLPVVYACVRLISEAVAQLPLNVYRRTSEGREEARDHPLWSVLHDAANEHMTAFTFRNTEQHHTLLWGNGYAEIQRNRNGQAIGLWPLLPDRTHPDKDRNNRLTFRTTINGEQRRLEHDAVMHIPALGFDGYVGYSPIAMAREAVGLGLAMEEFGAKFFANDAKSGGFIQHPGKLGPKAVSNISDSMQEQGGLDNAHRIKVLEEGAKFIQTTIPPEDAQFLGSREFQIAEIARIFNVPLFMIQSHEKTTSWGSGIEQMGLGFVRYTLQPWLVRWEQEANRKLFTEEERRNGYFVKFNVNALERGDMAARINYYASGIQNGWLNRNEARAKEELNERDGLGEFLEPRNMQPQGGESEE